MDNPNWYCVEVEFRAVREDDKYAVGCYGCGYVDYIYDRRYPRKDYIEYNIGRGCSCE